MSRELHRPRNPSAPPPGSLLIKDPSLIAATPDVMSEQPRVVTRPHVPFYKRCGKCLYNKEENTICGRTPRSWFHILAYSIMYLIFLSTYTMMFLYGSLLIVKRDTDYSYVEKSEFDAFTRNGIGLTATPVSSLGGYPLIWYKNGETDQYKIYVDAIDKLLKQRSDNGNLGPCAKPPYGYGDKPCVIIRINKLMNWSAKPLDLRTADARNAPDEVKKWIKSKKNMLWLHCNGYHPYDKEHIRSIRYYPDPPGFDPDIFPLDMKSVSPLVAVQLSDFTLGLSLALECKLWYENGESTVEFMIYVTPQSYRRSFGINNTSV